MDFGPQGRWSPPPVHWPLSRLRHIIDSWQTFMLQHSGWNSLCIESHDLPRAVSRFVDRRLTDSDVSTRLRVSKLLATLLAALCGTVYIYQGQELGMRNMPLDWGIDEYKDIETLNAYHSYPSPPLLPLPLHLLNPVQCPRHK